MREVYARRSKSDNNDSEKPLKSETNFFLRCIVWIDPRKIAYDEKVQQDADRTPNHGATTGLNDTTSDDKGLVELGWKRRL